MTERTGGSDATVVSGPVSVPILREFRDEVAGYIDGFSVGISMGGQIVQEKIIYPIFVIPYASFVIQITRPNYRGRIRKAVEEATMLAELTQ